MKPDAGNYENIKISTSLSENIQNIKNILDGSCDLLFNEVIISGHKAAYLTCEAMVSTSLLPELVFHPLMNLNLGANSGPNKVIEAMNSTLIICTEKANENKYGNIIIRLLSGFIIFFVDGADQAVAIGAQGFEKRGIDEPSSEINLNGSHEGFVETIRVNMSLIRRKMKTPYLKFEMFKLGSKSKTDICLAYLRDRVSMKMINSIKKKLEKTDLETILSSGYIEPFLEGKRRGIFPNISTTERPDKICSKLIEGRAALIVDGTPFVIIIPYLFAENFQTIDDYSQKPYYVTFIRIVKYAAFLISMLLPGVYVGIANFHPELINSTLLINLAESENGVPFPLALEAIVVLIAYELIREAGLRLPKAVGGTVSIIGGFIIGDAAVQSGLISTPLLIAVAFAATAAFVIPNLYQPITIFRMLFVVAGGLGGLYAIALLFAVVIMNVCSMEDFGIPATAPISPLTLKSMSDIFTRAGFQKLQKRNILISNLNGADNEVEE